MSRKECTLSDRTYFLYQDPEATHLLIQPIDEHDLEVLDQEIKAIKELSDKPFSLLAFMIKDWNQELTPWVAPSVFGKTPFGDGAEKTLEFITSKLLPEVQENIPHLILGLLQVCLPYGLGIRQTCLKALLLPLRLYGILSGLILHQRINR